MPSIMLFSGNANWQLANSVAHYLDIPLGQAYCGKFSDGETTVEIQENVRGRDVFIIQPTCAPTNDNLMELLLMADALRRASATRITAVMPYFGYARQDRRVRSARVPISAKVVADMMASVGISRLLTIDLHADQIQGFFYMPVDNVYSTPLMLNDIREQNFGPKMIVSPDVGGVVRARAIAKRLEDADLAIIDKRRPTANKTELMHIIGDIDGCDCILVDDIVDTAGTLCMAAEALKAHGARSVSAYGTHAVLSGPAVDNIQDSTLDELVVANTIPLTAEAEACNKIRVIDFSQMLARTIRRINEEESVSSMFDE